MIIKEEMYIRSLKRKRHIDIYVPDDYQSAKKRYPVLIINDGQNAFFDEQSYIGKSWGFLESVRELKLDVILVAIYCNFEPLKREDEYGTSVMSIQFNREGICTVSIKNRYNHTVNNPDATYGNDLDMIVPGLADSFATLLEKEYGLKLNNANIEKFEIPGYVVANDGKYYKYNMEIDGDYYCPGNIVIKRRKCRKNSRTRKRNLDGLLLFRLRKKRNKSLLRKYRRFIC